MHFVNRLTGSHTITTMRVSGQCRCNASILLMFQKLCVEASIVTCPSSSGLPVHCHAVVEGDARTAQLPEIPFAVRHAVQHCRGRIIGKIIDDGAKQTCEAEVGLLLERCDDSRMRDQHLVQGRRRALGHPCIITELRCLNIESRNDWDRFYM